MTPIEHGELKPCPNPFEQGCKDSKPKISRVNAHHSAFVECGYCGLSGPECETDEQAITAWNTRSLDRPTPPAQEGK